MQIQNLQIYNSSIAVSNNGPWIDISNLVSLSVQINAYNSGAGADIEVSNDPNVMIDGAAIGAPTSAPVLSQFASIPGNLGADSQLPSVTIYVKTTFITKWGETSASSESSLAVLAGNYLYVAAPVPTVAQAPFVTGYNVYASLTSGNEMLQTAPPYTPQRLSDGIGTQGGTVSSLTNQSTHFAISGAVSILQPGYALVNGVQQTPWLASALTDQSGGTASGISVSNGAGLSTLTPDTNNTVAVFIDTTNHNVMWTPSCMVWKYLRVTKGGTATLAWLMGQRS